MTDSTYWYRNNFNGACATDSVQRTGNNGGVGYVKYNITYTYYYFNPATLAKVELNITALPQRGAIGSDYPYTRNTYSNTNVNFKNYGDWPHIAQIVRGNTGTVAQNNKAWDGSKYGEHSTPITERRRDYPLDPWTAWYHDTTTTVPTVGMFAITNSIGWEVTSLAVTGIGPNSLLQQILPEGHQGDQYTMPRYSTFKYDYYIMSDAQNKNYSGIQDMCRRMNAPVSYSVGNTELFANNGLFIHTNDRQGNTALGVRVTLSYAINGTVVYSQFVNNVGNVSYLLLPDNTYHVQCFMYTDNLLTPYLVASETLTLNHKIQRTTYRTYNCNMANLTFDVVNWARNNEKLTGAMLKFRNVSSGLVVEQNITWNGYATFRLYTDGATQYNIVTEYGGTTRVSNITNPYTLTGNALLKVGMQIETTAINVIARDASTILGNDYNMTFEFYSSGNLTKKIGVESVSVSTDYDANYWTLNVDYYWSKINYYTVDLRLSTGFTKKLNSAGILAFYIHASNSTVETATEKVFVVINPIVTTMAYTLNDTVATQVSVVRGGIVRLEIDYQYGSPGTDITDATVIYTLNGVPTSIPYNEGNGNYSATIYTASLDKGTYVFTFKATRANYEDRLDSLVLIVLDRPTSMALTSQGTASYGENFTIDITLTDAVNGTGINKNVIYFTADVQGYSITGTVTGGSDGNYVAMFDGSDFTTLGTYTIRVVWDWPSGVSPYYQSQSGTTLIRIVNRASTLTYDPVGNVPYGDDAVVNLRFEDTLNGSGIVGAALNVNATPSINTPLGDGNYRVIVNTRVLGNSLGTRYLKISVNWTATSVPYYKNQTVLVKVVVVNRPSQLVSDAPAPVQFGEDIIFSVVFSDLSNGSRLSGAAVSISTTNVSSSVALQGDQSYRISIATLPFPGPGVYYTMVYANWSTGISPFYTNKSVVVKLTILERSTQVSYDSLAPAPYLNNFTFYINFLDGINGSTIPLASLAGNLSHPIKWNPVSPGRYLVSINTTHVGTPGIGDSSVLITITAPAGSPYYADNQIILRLTTTQRPTSLSYDALAPTAYGVDVIFNMNYLDALNGRGVHTYVTVTSTTPGVLVNALDLGTGVFRITVHDLGALTVGSHSVTFRFNWTQTQPPYYANQVLSVNIMITARPVQLTYTGLVPTAYGEQFDFTLTLRDGISNALLSGRAGDISSNASTEVITPLASPGLYNVKISTTETTVGSQYFTLDVAGNATHASTTIAVLFTTINRPVQLVSNAISAVQYGETFSIVVRYTDGINGTGLNDKESSISLNRTHNAPVGTGNGYYTIIVPTTQFSALGTYPTSISVAASAGAPYYAAVQITVQLQVASRQASFVVDQVGAAQYWQNFTILVHYTDALNSSDIAGTITTNNTHAVISGTSGDYTIRLNSTWVGLGTHDLRIDATYPAGSKPFYTNSTSIITLIVTPRGASLTAEKQSNVQFGENITISITFQDSVDGRMINIPVGQIAVNVIGQPGVTKWSSGSNGIYQVKIGTWGLTSTGSFSINISTSWIGAPYYYNRSQIVPVTVSPRSNLFYAGAEIYQTQPYNTLFNVSLYYIDTNNGSVIPDSVAVLKSVVARTPGSSGTTIPAINLTSCPINYYSAQQKWVITFNSSLFGDPMAGYRVTMQFNWNPTQKPFYINQTITFNITTSIASTQLIVLGSFVEQAGDNHTLDFYYINRISGKGVDNATITVNGTTSPTALIVGGAVIWDGTAWYNATGGYYRLTFNVTTLLGNIHPFTIVFSKNNFDTVMYSFALVKTKLGSEIVVINSTSNRILGENMSMVVKFQYQGSGNPIIDGVMRISSDISSNYWINNTEYYWRQLPEPGLYNVTMATGELTTRINKAGFFLIYLNMSAGIAESRVISLQFEMKQIPTNISAVFLNGVKSVATNPSITTQITKSLNITAEFVRLFPSLQNITDSNRVYIASSSLALEYDLVLFNNRYSYVLPMSALGIGTHFIFIIAQRDNAQQSTKTITITVTQVATSLNLYLNQTMSTSIQVKWGQFINVSAYYNNTVDNLPITGSGTFVSVSGGSVSWNLTAAGDYWTYIIDSKLLGPPASYTMTISASRANYMTSSKVFTIQLVEVPTNRSTTNGTTITAIWSTMFTVYVRYSTYLGETITGATILSNPNINSSAASFSSGYYRLTYNASAFGLPQIYNLVITMSLTNYTSQSITFSIDVHSIPTTVPAISDISLYWGDQVNISAQFLDTLHGSIPLAGATIDAGAFNGALVSAPSYAGGSYTIQFYSAKLVIQPTVVVISLVFSKMYYTTVIVTVTVNVQRVPTSISIYDSLGGLNSSLSVYWSDNVTFTANVRRTDKNTNVADAILTTNPGTATIQNLGNGNYTIRFNSTRLGIPGIYSVSVTATRVNYTTVIASLTIQVKAPPTVLIITNATTGMPLSAVNLYWGQQLVFNVTLKDTVHNKLLVGWNATFGPAAIQPTSYSPVLTRPNMTVTYAALTPDFYALTITATKANYTMPSTSLNVVVSTIQTSLTSYNSDDVVTTQFTATWGTTLDVFLRYRNTMNNTIINPASATITTSASNKLFEAPENFTELIRFRFDCALFVPGVYTISFQASKLYHDVSTAFITLTINAVNTTLTIFNANSTVKNSEFLATWGQLVTIDIQYNESTGTNLASSTTITAAPTWDSIGVSSIAGRLAIRYDTTPRVPGIYSITITGTLANRTSQSTRITIEIRAVNTTINTYYATNYTSSQFFNVYWNEALNVDVLYQSVSGTNLTTLAQTTTTAVPLAYTISNSSISGRARLTFNTTTISPNIYQVTITSSRPNYVTSSISILINVLARPTSIQTFYTNMTTSFAFTTYATYSISILVQYNDTRLAASITNSPGTTIGATMAATQADNGLFKQLTFTIASTGLYTVIVSGERLNYDTAQQSITINVLPIPTVLTAFNGTAIATSLKATWGDSFVIALEYNNTYEASRISSATVTLGSPSMTGTYNPASGKYEFTINTVSVGQSGIYSLTFTASRANYVTSVASVTLEVLQVPMKLDAYNLNGPLNSQFSIEWNKVLSFTVRYHLVSMPSIALRPSGNISTTFPGTIIFGGAGENISISVNSSRFGGTGIFSVTFVAMLANHTTESLLVTIQVVNLQTRLSIEMSSTAAPAFVNITASRQYFVNFNNNFTVRFTYSTLTGSRVDGASVYMRFIEGSSTWYNYGSVNATIVNAGNGQYLLTLNTTTQLGDFSQYSLVVTIFRQNFTLLSEPFYVYPLKLQTRLNVSDTITFERTVFAGQKFTVNYTETFTIYCALYDLMGTTFISKTQYPSLTYTATLKGRTYSPASILPNGTAIFVFNTTLIDLDVGTSNYITLAGEAGFFYPSGSSINLEVKSVPTSITVMNGSVPVIAGSTLQVYYTKNFTLSAVYTDTLNSANITNLAGVSVTARIYGYTITGIWAGSGKWSLFFDSFVIPASAGSTPQVIVSASYVNYTTATFSFNLAIREVPTTLSVQWQNSSGLFEPITSSVTLNWSAGLTMRVYFMNTLDGVKVGTYSNPASIKATYGVDPTYVDDGTPTVFAYYELFINSSLLRGGNTHTIIVTGNMQNYTGSEFRFNLIVLEVPTKLYVQNSTAYLNNGDTSRVYYGDTLRLFATYQNIITGQNISSNGPTIRAVVFGVTIPATNIGGGLWLIDINTSTIAGLLAGSTPQVIISASWINYSQAAFSFNLQVLDLPTELIVPAMFQNVTQYVWGQNFSLAVKYNDTHNDVLINGTLVANYPAASSIFNGTDYILVFSTSSIGTPGIYRITLTASKLNYAAASFTITVHILEVPTTMTVLFNGQPFLAISLKEVVTITVNYSRATDGLPVQNALVTVTYTNDKTGTTLNRTLTFAGGVYRTTITLDLNTFYAEPKFFIVQAYRANYTLGRAAPVLQIKPVVVVPHQNQTPENPVQSVITNVDPQSTLRLDFQLFDTSTGIGIIDGIANTLIVNISSPTLKIYNKQMNYIGNGTWRYSIGIPQGFGATYTVTISVFFADPEVKRQFDIQNNYEYTIQTKAYQGSAIPEWVFYLILAALVVVVVYFVLYQVRFKYPPIIRKIHDLSRAVRQGKPAAKISVQKVASREEGIYNEFAKLLNEYSFLQTHSKSIAALAKKTKQKGYVPPAAKDTLAKDFDLAVKEKVVEVKHVASAIFPKEGPKKITTGPPKAEYVEPEKPAPVIMPPKPAAPGVIPPGTPSIPAVPAPGEAPGLAKPVSIAALPKPAAKPLPAKPGALVSTGEGQEGLYGELVKMEQKKYKAQRSLRDLKAKKEKGILTDEEYEQYRVKFEEALDKINEKIGEIRRKLVNF
ncbi:MAG: hypothetical protein Q6373_010960 [Candidatus Sigynarchaeota archaeon]